MEFLKTKIRTDLEQSRLKIGKRVYQKVTNRYGGFNMRGYVVREYLFEGCSIPVKFMDTIYNTSQNERTMKFEGTDQANYGDDITVRVSAESNETFDLFLGEWANWVEVQ